MSIIHKACFCCQLSTAGVLLGWLGAVGYFIVSVLLIVAMVNIDVTEADDIWDIIKNIVLCITFIGSLVNAVGCVCLMIGAIKKIRQFILPWLFGQIVFIILVAIAFFIDFIRIIQLQRSYMIFPFCLLTLFLAFQIYFWICVYSLFQEIRTEDIKKLGVETDKSTTLKDQLPPYSSLA